MGIRTPSNSTTATVSPYDPSPNNNQAKYNESLLNSLELQNNEEMDTMGQKVAMLKNLGEKWGRNK